MEYYKSKSSVNEYIELAKDVSGAQLIEKLKEVLPLKSKLLEIGSGPGTDFKILKNDFNVTASDYSKEFLNHLNSSNPNTTFLELNAVTLSTDEKFDGIYSNKVLHHLSDTELADSIDRQVHILNSNGIVCHSFWKGVGSEVFKGMFVNYHTKDALVAFFEKSFDIISIESYQEFDNDDSLLLIAQKR